MSMTINQVTRLVILTTTVFGATLVGPRAHAQDENAPQEAGMPMQQGPTVIVSLRPKGQYLFGSSLDESNGDVAVWRGGFDLDFVYPRQDQSRWVFGLGYENSHYDFDPPNSMFAADSDPFSQIHSFDFDLTGYIPAEDGWSWFAGAFARLAGETDAAWEDAFSVGGLAGVSKQYNENLRLGFGLRVSSQIEDDPLILPAIDVNWKVDDRWSVRTIGPGVEAAYQLENGMEFAFGARWENRRFRLDDDPVTRAAVVEDTGVPIFARLSHNPDPRTSIELTGGFIMGREFRVEDRDGENGRDFDTDGSLFLGMSARFRF